MSDESEENMSGADEEESGEEGGSKEESGEGGETEEDESGNGEEEESDEGEQEESDEGEQEESDDEEDDNKKKKGKKSEKDDKEKTPFEKSQEIKIDIVPFAMDPVEPRKKSALELLQEVNQDLNDLYQELKSSVTNFGVERKFDYVSNYQFGSTMPKENFNYDFEFMEGIGKNRHTQSDAGLKARIDFDPLGRAKVDENIQVSIPSKTPSNIEFLAKPKAYKEEEVQSSQENFDELIESKEKKRDLMRSSGGSSYFNKNKSQVSKYRTVEDLYRMNKQPVIYSKDPSRGRRIKNFAQLNYSLNKKFSDSESNFNKLKRSRSKERVAFSPRQQQIEKPKNLKHAMNILLDRDSR